MDVMLQEQKVGSGEDKNPVQQSSMAYGLLNADDFIQEITSTIEAKLRNEIESLIHEHKLQREESDAKIDELTLNNKKLMQRVDYLIKQNEDLAADNRKVMAQFNSAQCRIHGQNRLLIRSVTGKMILHHHCLPR
jgi:FtsZ-binding cell division protein ZapB